MQNLPKDKLQKLLSTTGDEYIQALQAVQAAFAWCASAANPQSLTSRPKALQALLELDKATDEGVKYLSCLPEIIEKCNPGPSLKDPLLKNFEAIKKSAADISQLQLNLKQISQQEEELKAKKSKLDELLKQRQIEEDKLKKRNAEIEHLIRLTESGTLEELRQQVAELDRHLTPEVHETGQLEKSIEQKAQSLVVISEKRLKNLHENTEKLLADAESKRKALLDTEEKLRDAHERYDKVQNELSERMDELQPYIKADRIVAEAIPDSNNVMDMLNKADNLIKDAERAIKTAIEREQEKIDQISKAPFTIGGR